MHGNAEITIDQYGTITIHPTISLLEEAKKLSKEDSGNAIIYAETILQNLVSEKSYTISRCDLKLN